MRLRGGSVRSRPVRVHVAPVGLGLRVNSRRAIHLCRVRESAWSKLASESKQEAPDVLLSRKRAFVRFASPSMFCVPIKLVLSVLTALRW